MRRAAGWGRGSGWSGLVDRAQTGDVDEQDAALLVELDAQWPLEDSLLGVDVGGVLSA
jgi:hypothetical protein